jgi:hypothetical protein
MIRLERSDIEEAQRLDAIAAAADMNGAHFQKRFGYLVGLGERPTAS